MFSRLHHARSRLLSLTRVHHEARLTFSSSAIAFARRLSQRNVGERANLAAGSHPSQETEDEAAEDKLHASESKGEEELDRWLFAGEAKANQSGIRPHKDPYGHFRKSIASSFREPSPRNWLGRDVPFPLNPSFKPPIPLSDEFRTRLYRAYMANPELNSVRTLATRYHLSINRVNAILRLKGTEKAWEKDKPLQNGFTKGMEHLLGVTEAAKHAEKDVDELLESTSSRSESHDRYDVEEADSQDEVEGNSKARQRYQRLFWESVAEGEEPVMPSVLEAQRGAALAHTKAKGNATLVERAPGRPAIMFIDIGDAFVDKKEKERREREGARRSMVKARRRMQNH